MEGGIEGPAIQRAALLMTMTPMELFTIGRLSEALELQRVVVERAPDNLAEHMFLFELQLFAGEFDAALKSISSITSPTNDLREYIDDCQLLIQAEESRSGMASSEPKFFEEPPGHVKLRLEALNLVRESKDERASAVLDAADRASSHIAGHVDGREFDGLRDGDDRFASVLEVFIGADYFWVPFESIRRLRLGAVETARDQLYVPAALKLRSGPAYEVFLPALYPASWTDARDGIRCGRETDWLPYGAGHVRGVGLRVWTFGEEELTPWEFTQIEFAKC